MAALVACVSAAFASSTPVGTLPKGPVTTVTVRAGQNFEITLPKSTVKGRVWRVARPYSAKVVKEVGEGESGSSVWVKYRAVTPGTTKVVYAVTRGETAKAYASHTFRITVATI